MIRVNIAFQTAEQCREFFAPKVERVEVPAPLPDVTEHSLQVLKTLAMAVNGANKIAGIKCIREMTGLGLKEAKDIFEMIAGRVVVMP